MTTVLLDEQLSGYVGYCRLLSSSETCGYLAHLIEVQFRTFAESGLASGASDLEVWQYCQAHRCYLLTDNRNADGEESLVETIRRHNTPTSLPVFNIANRNRFARKHSYALRSIESLLDKLFYAENLLGTGRLFVP